ncbi:MAG: hypothetical protein WC969_11715 [Elusimicrobiota bacterium]|jgi:hypothetical protein
MRSGSVLFSFLICGLCTPAHAIRKPTPEMERIYDSHIAKMRGAQEELFKANREFEAATDPSVKGEYKRAAKRHSDEIVAEFNKAIHVAMKAYGMDEYRQEQGVAIDPRSSAYRQQIQFTPVCTIPLARYEVRKESEEFKKRGISAAKNGGEIYGEHYSDGASLIRPEAFIHGMGFLAATIHHEHVHFLNSITPGAGDRMVGEEDEKSAFEATLKSADIFGLKDINLNAGTDKPFYSALSFVQKRLEEESSQLETRFKELERRGCKQPRNMDSDCRHIAIGGLDANGKYPLKIANTPEEFAQIRALDAQAENDVASEFIEREIAKKLLARARELGNTISNRQVESSKDRELETARNIMGSINKLGKKVTEAQQTQRQFQQDVRAAADSCGFDTLEPQKGLFRQKDTGFRWSLRWYSGLDQQTRLAQIKVGMMLANACMNRDPGIFSSSCNDGMDAVGEYWDRLNPQQDLTTVLSEVGDSDMRACVEYLIFKMNHDAGKGRNSSYGDIKGLVRQFESTYHPKESPSSSSGSNNDSPSDGGEIDRGNDGSRWEGRPIHLKTLPEILRRL